MRDMTRSHVCHDSFTCVPWLIHMCVMTHAARCLSWSVKIVLSCLLQRVANVLQCVANMVQCVAGVLQVCCRCVAVLEGEMFVVV